MKKTIILLGIFFITITFQFCKNKNDFGENFVGQWQNINNEKEIYTITKINETTFEIEKKGYVDPPSGGAFPIPGDLHPGLHETLTLENQNLVIMGMVMVSYISDSELLIDKDNCKRIN